MILKFDEWKWNGNPRMDSPILKFDEFISSHSMQLAVFIPLDGEVFSVPGIRCSHNTSG